MRITAGPEGLFPGREATRPSSPLGAGVWPRRGLAVAKPQGFAHRRDRGRASSCLRLRLEMDLETIPPANGDRFARGAASVRAHKGNALKGMEGPGQESLPPLRR